MKYAWWVFFFIAIFLFCTQRVAAAEIAGFDPTAQYVVHSTPFAVPDQTLLPSVVTPTVVPKSKLNSLVQPTPTEQIITDIASSDELLDSFLSKMGKGISSLFSKIKDAI